MAPHFHTGISIWKRGLTLPHIEMETVRFHMGITYIDPHMEMENDISPYGNGASLCPYCDRMKWLPVSIWRSPYGNGDWHVSVSVWGPIQSLTVTKQSSCPFGDWGKKSPYGNVFHMGIAVSIWWSLYGNLINSHLGTPHYQTEFVTILGLTFIH